MHIIDPEQTPRAEAFRLWMAAPMPMVTLTKTFDVTPLVRAAKRGDAGFHPLLCWCIGRAALDTPEFFLLPVENRLAQYHALALSTVVALPDGGIATCDIPVSREKAWFLQDYQTLTARVRETGEPCDLSADRMVIGVSALTATEIDSAENLYAGVFNNPFLIWGKVRRKWRRAELPISFQFHHVQMDGGHAAAFLERLQQVIGAAAEE